MTSDLVIFAMKAIHKKYQYHQKFEERVWFRSIILDKFFSSEIPEKNWRVASVRKAPPHNNSLLRCKKSVPSLLQNNRYESNRKGDIPHERNLICICNRDD
jgi:hypothetical protein